VRLTSDEAGSERLPEEAIFAQTGPQQKLLGYAAFGANID